MAEGHEIAMALRRAYLAMHRQADAALSPFELTANQFVLLALLDERDGVSQRDLVDRASSDPNTIRPMLKSLEKKGFVKREPDPSDGRAWVVGITSKGRRTYKRVRGETEDFRVRLLSGLDDHESDALLQALDKVAEVMSESLATPID
ncbi:MAG: MarR family winged helix-turn-helix transcriptional regulator [Rubripirellula sp.]